MLISKFKKNNESFDKEEFKKIVDFKLPEKYLSFMSKYNGGETPDTNWTGKGKSDIRVFFGFHIDEKNWDLENLLTYTSMKELIEQQKFPIAENSFGDTFCIDSTDGSIWIIYHDESRNKKIADDFESFIQGCKSKKLGHIRTIEERRQSLLEKRGREPTEAQLKGWQEEIDIYSKMKQEEIII